MSDRPPERDDLASFEDEQTEVDRWRDDLLDAGIDPDYDLDDYEGE